MTGQRGPSSTGLSYRRLDVPMRLRKAQQAWGSLVTSCKGVAFDIVNTEESAREVWVKLVQHYQASGLKERRRSPLISTR